VSWAQGLFVMTAMLLLLLLLMVMMMKTL